MYSLHVTTGSFIVLPIFSRRNGQSTDFRSIRSICTHNHRTSRHRLQTDTETLHSVFTEIQVFPCRHISRAYLSQLFPITGILLQTDTYIPFQLTGFGSIHLQAGIQRSCRTLRSHFHFINGAVFVKSDRFQTSLPHGTAGMGRTMVKHIPLTVELYNRAMIIPRFRIASGIIHNDSLVLVRSHRRSTHGIAQAGRPSFPADVGIDEIIVFSALDHITTFVKAMLLFRQDAILHGRPVERFQISIHSRSLGRELSPEIVCLSIIVYKDIGVNLFRSLYLYSITERTDRRITRCHVFLTIRNVIIQIVTTVFIDGIRSIQCFLPLERLAMQRPVLQIIRGKDMIGLRAIGAWD